MSSVTDNDLDMKPRALNADKEYSAIKDDAVDKIMPINDLEDDVSSFPLFSLGLPSDFASNKTLSAIASLMEDNEPTKVDDSMYPSQPKAGGGKAFKTRKSSHKQCPYSKRETLKPKTTVKEIELFMKMWKP